MKTELKASLSPKKTFVLLSLLTVLSGILGCIFAELVLPITIALLGLIYIFEKNESRIFSYISSIALVVINVALVLLKITSSVFSLQAIVLALILCFALKKSLVKSNTAFVMSIICAIFTLISYVLLAMIATQDYSFDGVVKFYSEIETLLREVFVKIGVEMYAPMGDMFNVEITPESIGEIFDNQVNMIISYLFICAFAVVGVSIKLFCILFGRLSGDDRPVKEWKFEPETAFAYAYIVVMLLAIFSRDPNSVFYVVVNNLYNIFMVVFSYVGLNVIANLLSAKLHKALSVLIPIGAVLLIGRFAIQIFAVVGVLSITNKNRMLPKE